MADSVDRVFGHALNTVNKIRPGSQKPPLADRQELYGLYKQSMEGDVAELTDRPSAKAANSSSPEHLRKEQEKWDAWKSNEGLSRTEAKRRYIEKLIETMHKYASSTPEARELVEELEFVWDQIRSNSQHSSSEHSSPLRHMDRGEGYVRNMSSSQGATGELSSSTAAMDSSVNVGRAGDGGKLMRVLSPVSQAEEEEMRMEEEKEEEFVDAPISQVDEAEVAMGSEVGAEYRNGGTQERQRLPVRSSDGRWRRKMESTLMKLTAEIAALRENLESRRYFTERNKHSLFGWVLRLSWWAVQLFVADAVLLWVVILYMRRKQDHRLEMAVRVLLGDAVAQVQRVGNQVKMPTLPRMTGRKSN